MNKNWELVQIGPLKLFQIYICGKLWALVHSNLPELILGLCQEVDIKRIEPATRRLQGKLLPTSPPLSHITMVHHITACRMCHCCFLTVVTGLIGFDQMAQSQRDSEIHLRKSKSWYLCQWGTSVWNCILHNVQNSSPRIIHHLC